jgi:hypothetical protein
MLDGTYTGGTLFIAIVAGALGMGYLIYGRRQAKYVAMFSGLLLLVYPLFVTNLLWSCVIGAALAIAPFVVDY